MAFDGLLIHSLVNELAETLSNSRISKIAQPEREELILTFKGSNGNVRLLISANASLPLIYLASENKVSPLSAPNFCMLLRKHIANGRISDISQMGYERVIRFTIDHLDEMGDPAVKYLYVEIMGKHSNIIFTNSEDIIIDSIKHIGSDRSSIREVLPGRKYFIPGQEGKIEPNNLSYEIFLEHTKNNTSISKALYTSYIGLSPCIAEEIAYRANLDGDMPIASLSDADKIKLYHHFTDLIDEINEGNYAPNIITKDKKYIEFSPISLKHFEDADTISFSSISGMLEDYYSSKNKQTNMSQKSSEMRKNVQIILDRNRKKLTLQEKQLEDTKKMDTAKLYGEMLKAYAYQLEEGQKSVTVTNYYTGEDIRIPMDDTLSPMDNAKKYFEKYNKLKRTKAALEEYIEETKSTIAHLESIESSIALAESDADLAVIREELSDYGYMKKKSSKKKTSEKSKPIHYVTNDGYHIYVGKNNYQNDELTFKFATGNDWWFHAKKIPGSHVIVKAENQELPDHIYEIAAGIAAYYSSGRDADKLEIDYLQKKNVKKPNKANPGFVIYYTNYSMTIKPSIDGVTEVK